MSTIPPGIQRKNEARRAAIGGVYSNTVMDEKDRKPPFSVILDVLEYYNEKVKDGELVQPDRKFLHVLIEGVCTKQQEIDPIIEKNLGKGWKMERLGPLLHALLLTATFELMILPQIPFKVIINEYMNIAKAYCDEDEVGFINAILNTIAHQVRDVHADA